MRRLGAVKVLAILLPIGGCVETELAAPASNAPVIPIVAKTTSSDLAATFEKTCMAAFPDFQQMRGRFAAMGFTDYKPYPGTEPSPDSASQENRRLDLVASYGTDEIRSYGSDGVDSTHSYTSCTVMGPVLDASEFATSIRQGMSVGEASLKWNAKNSHAAGEFTRGGATFTVSVLPPELSLNNNPNLLKDGRCGKLSECRIWDHAFFTITQKN